MEQDAGNAFVLAPEWACWQYGWRRSYTPREFTRTFALSAEADAVLIAGRAP